MMRFSERGIRSRASTTKVAGAEVVFALCRHCLTAVLSERSEDKLVFLINVQRCPVREKRKFKRTNNVPLPSGWALTMRAIKCLKGIRWMPWR